VDAEHLIQAQAEAVASACASLAAVYRLAPDSNPGKWLDVAASELWRFASARRLLDAPAAAWIALFDLPPDSPPRSLGLGLMGCLTQDHRCSLTSFVQGLLPSIGLADTFQRQMSGSLDSNMEGVLRAAVLPDPASADGGSALVLGGLLKVDGQLDRSIENDPLIAAMFTAIAGAAADCVLHPIAVRRALMARLSLARQRVLTLMVEGLTTLEIGQKLERSPHTVHDHILGIFRTFGVNSRREVLDLWCGRTMPPPPAPEEPSLNCEIVTPPAQHRSQAQ
jgi:DNA-binding CsgD family transcriptional regulator